MKRGKSVLITSGVSALLALLASTASASEIGVCPPYSKTFGPDDPPEAITAFINEINLRPGGGTVKLAGSGRFSIQGMDPVTGVVCIRPADIESEWSLSMYGTAGSAAPVSVSGGILTINGNSPWKNSVWTEITVQAGGALFVSDTSLESGLTVKSGGFSQVSNSQLWFDLYNEANNAGTLIARDSLIEGDCSYKDGGVFYNSGRLIMEHVTFRAGCYDRYPDPPAVTGMINTGVVSMKNVTFFGGSAGAMTNAYLLAGSGIYEAVNSVFDRGDGDIVCDGSGSPVQLIDLGYNVFNSLENCLVPSPSETSLEAEPGLVYMTGNWELGPASPAIDLIPLAACRAYDRLGRPRTDGDGDGIVACDAGALEFTGTAITVKSPPFWLEYGELDVSVEDDLYVVLMSGPAFDPADVVVESVVFGDTDALPRGWNYVDRNKDAVPDLRLRYRLWDVDLACGQQEIDVSASTTDGRVVAGVLKLDVTGCSY